jgi:hypothetical protein
LCQSGVNTCGCQANSDCAGCTADSLVQRVQRLRAVRQHHAVDVQEHQRRQQAGAFIAIKERMVAHDVLQVGRRHVEQARVQQRAAKGCLGLGDGRLQEAAVAQTIGTAKPLQLQRMQLDDVGDRQELYCYFASFSNTVA